MTESTPPEGQQPLTFVQKQRLRRSLTEKVLNRAESDPEWRELLLDDPELAMREANFPEAEQLTQQGAPQEAEVTRQFASQLELVRLRVLLEDLTQEELDESERFLDITPAEEGSCSTDISVNHDRYLAEG